MKKTILRCFIAVAMLYGTINKTFVQSRVMVHAAGFTKTSIQQTGLLPARSTIKANAYWAKNEDLLARAQVYRFMY